MSATTHQLSSTLREIIENPPHHAFLVLGGRQAHFERIRLHIREMVTRGLVHTADVWAREFEQLAIDDARELKEIQHAMPNGPRRIVLVSLQNIQHEAQNSLLKLFEEPSDTTIFFICAENSEIFLPIVLSRFFIYDGRDERTRDSGSDARHAYAQNIEKFLSQTIADRLQSIELITKEKDRGAAEQFLNALEETLYKRKEKLGLESAWIFEQIFEARRFLQSRSSSVKMILEHISSIIPVLR